jgi:hypothetical protein
MVEENQCEPVHRRVPPAAAVAVSILVAVIAGLSIGNAAQPDAIDPTAARQQALADSGEATLIEVRQETSRQGYRDGRKLGIRQGQASGEGAGRADGRIGAQIVKIRAAQSAADRAESALAEISDPPPTPGG